jgi:hypothetical protein
MHDSAQTGLVWNLEMGSACDLLRLADVTPRFLLLVVFSIVTLLVIQVAQVDRNAAADTASAQLR